MLDEAGTRRLLDSLWALPELADINVVTDQLRAIRPPA